MKRGKPEPLIDEAVFCIRMGWTLEDLYNTPTRFLELVKICLNTQDDITSTVNARRKREFDKIRLKVP